MKRLAVCWAQGNSPELRKFDFVFYLPLQSAKEKQSIEDMIIQQHKGLKGNKVQPQTIRAILGGKNKLRVLIITDGYDEYTKGTNVAIDEALEKEQLRDCCILLASRNCKQLSALADCTDVEVDLTGFSDDGVKEYITKYTKDERTSEQWLKDWDKFRELLRTPFLLSMICFLQSKSKASFDKAKTSFDKTKTGITNALAERLLKWKTAKPSSDESEQDPQSTMLRLGKLAWEGLQDNQLQQTFDKVQI